MCVCVYARCAQRGFGGERRSTLRHKPDKLFDRRPELRSHSTTRKKDLAQQQQQETTTAIPLRPPQRLGGNGKRSFFAPHRWRENTFFANFREKKFCALHNLIRILIDDVYVIPLITGELYYFSGFGFCYVYVRARSDVYQLIRICEGGNFFFFPIFRFVINNKCKCEWLFCDIRIFAYAAAACVGEKFNIEIELSGSARVSLLLRIQLRLWANKKKNPVSLTDVFAILFGYARVAWLIMTSLTAPRTLGNRKIIWDTKNAKNAQEII